MIEKKVLNKKLIKEILHENYNLDVVKITKVSLGSAEIYKVLCDREYIIKLYQTKYSKEDIIDEINVINFLRRKDFKVPNLIKNNNNQYYVLVKSRYMVLQDYIEGKVKDKFCASKKQIAECGYLHGLLVKNLIDYKTIKTEDINDWLDFKKNIKKLQTIIDMGNNQIVIDDLNKKIELMKDFKYDLSDISKISYYVSHGDFSYLQLIYSESPYVLDFIRVKKLPIIWEVMRSYSYMDKACKSGTINIDNLILYVKEFIKSVPLNKYDLKYMPYLYLCQLLRSTYGYKEIYKDNNNDETILEFAHFRTQLCINLYKNCDEISKRLEQLI